MKFPAILYPLSSILFLFPLTSLAADNSESPISVSPAKIEKSIQYGVKFLLAAQARDGSWPGQSFHKGMDIRNENNERRATTDPDGGRTALITLALLSAGESAQSVPLGKAIDFLKHKEMNQTYAIALRAAVYSMLPEAMRRKELLADELWLRKAMNPKGPAMGLYTYGPHNGLNEADLSNSQYGVLGVWYAAEAGVEVPADYWHKVEAGWLKSQHADGGWSYRPQNEGWKSYMSMTLAGLATLYITNDYLHAHEAHALPAANKSAAIDKGLHWMDNHFSVQRNTAAGQYWGNDDEVFIHYMLFGFERVGEASGLTHFGDHVWFPEGASYLLHEQAEDGSWPGSIGPTIDTAYAILYLSRGVSPVALQKLEFPGHWNNRSRDAANIVRWLRRQTERHVNWQVVSADATDDELRDSSILYVASDAALKLTDDQKSRIKRYLNDGGLLFCVNEGGADLFTKSIEQLAKEFYPDSPMRDLPPDHDIFNENFAIKNLPYTIRGVSNGRRELIVLVPTADLSWQYQSMAIATANPNQAFPLIANLYLYSTGKSNPRLKGEKWKSQ